MSKLLIFDTKNGYHRGKGLAICKVSFEKRLNIDNLPELLKENMLLRLKKKKAIDISFQMTSLQIQVDYV